MANFLHLEPLGEAFGDRAAGNIKLINDGVIGTILRIFAPLLQPFIVSYLDSHSLPASHRIGEFFGSFSPIPISKTFESLLPSHIMKGMYVAGTVALTTPFFVLARINPLLGFFIGIPLGILLFFVLIIPLDFSLGGLADLGALLLAFQK